MQLTHSLESQIQDYPDSDNGRIAMRLESQRNDIINEWLQRVQRSPSHPADAMTLEQVRDHLPDLFDNLNESLNRYGSYELADLSEEDGEQFGSTH